MSIIAFWGSTSPTVVTVTSVLALLGAGSAAGSLALAGMGDDSELLGPGDEALGLGEGEPAPVRR